MTGGEGVVPARRPVPRPITGPAPSKARGAVGSARSLSQRVRSTSSPESLERARRNLSSKGTQSPAPGSARIKPGDVLDRYRGTKAGVRMGSTKGDNGHASQLPMLSDKRNGTAGKGSSVAPGARPLAPRTNSEGKGAPAVRRPVSASSAKSASGKPSRAPGSRTNAQRVDDIRKAAEGRSGKGQQTPNTKGRPVAVDTRSGKNSAKAPSRDAKGRDLADKGKDRSPGARPVFPGSKGDSRPPSEIKKSRDDFVRRIGKAKAAPTALGGSAGRPTVIGAGRTPVRPLGTAGLGVNTGQGRFGGVWNNGFYNRPDWYYNSCYWNTWGNSWNSPFGAWYGAPLFATGYWWNSYWANGGNWGFGFRRPWRSRFANLYFFGPFLPASQTFVNCEPETEIVYVEVPAEEPVAGGEVLPGEGVVPAGDAPQPVGPTIVPRPLSPEATEPSLQRELNRASAYYLTQGDRAFRETRYGDAVHFYAKSVEFSTESGILYLVLSDALFATGDYRYAAYSLRQAFEREPSLASNVIDKRDFYADPAEFEAQLATLERFVSDHALDMDARLVLAANYVFGDRAADAVELLTNPFSEELARTDEGRLLLEVARYAASEAAEADSGGF